MKLINTWVICADRYTAANPQYVIRDQTYHFIGLAWFVACSISTPFIIHVSIDILQCTGFIFTNPECLLMMQQQFIIRSMNIERDSHCSSLYTLYKYSNQLLYERRHSMIYTQESRFYPELTSASWPDVVCVPMIFKSVMSPAGKQSTCTTCSFINY